MDDAVNIQFTSGTTGLPKGATLSHHNLINNAFFVGEATGIEPGSRVCIPVPLYHCFGMVMGNLGCVTHAATMVYPSESFEPLKTLETLEAERCDVLYGVPTMFIAQLNHPEFARFDLSSLRRGIMAGAPCPIEVMKEVASTMHMSEITIAYGMTETSPVSFQSSRDDPLELRVSTVGRIQPHLEVKIVDRDGRVVPRGEAGELCTRGYSVMLGYWNDEVRTREAIDSAGWMHTGDLATIDDDGYCRIVGRIKDMVIRGGENIYPREVEEYLYRPSRYSGRPGFRRARHEIRRRAVCLDRRQGRRHARRRGGPQVLSGPDLSLQSPAPHPLRREFPVNRNRQGPEVCNARGDDRGIRPRRTGT